MELLCIKNLYKSTYGDQAFVLGKKYVITSSEDGFIFLTDESGKSFAFSKERREPFHYYLDYFTRVPAYAAVTLNETSNIRVEAYCKQVHRTAVHDPVAEYHI